MITIEGWLCFISGGCIGMVVATLTLAAAAWADRKANRNE